MGCGASNGTVGRRKNSVVSRRGSYDSESDSDDDAPSAPACSTPYMDKMWKVKIFFFDSENDSCISIDTFALRTGVKMADMYRTLKIFSSASKSSKLDVETLASQLNWPTTHNMIVKRQVRCPLFRFHHLS